MDVLRNFLEVLANVIRTSPLAGKVDIAALQAAVAANWAAALEKDLLDLRPLYNALIANPRVEVMDAARACLFLKSRERRLGVSVRLPFLVESLDEVKRAELLAQVSRQGIHSGVTNPGLC